jgi:hypothetical protein
VATLYSTQFYRGLIYGGFVDLFTVPAGKRYVVRDIRAWPPQVSTNPIYPISVQDSETGVPICAWSVPYIQPFRMYDWDGRQAYDAGQTVQAYSITDAGEPWGLSVFGYSLTLP